MPDSPKSSEPPSQQGTAAVEVRTPGRIHIGMFSFGRADVRSFGGVGMMIERPAVHLRASRAAGVTVRGPLADRALAAAEACMRHWRIPASDGVEVEVLSTPREHVGLGCGTQLSLAVAAAIRELRRDRAEEPLAPHETVLMETADTLDLGRAVGRGKRSCIGLHGFARGGLIVEAGRLAQAEASDTGQDEEFSPLVARVRLPSAWRCLVVMQKGVRGLHGERERDAFASLPPVPLEITSELARIALLELVPAATTGDFRRFADAVTRYGAVAGRPFEPVTSTLESSELIRDVCTLLEELGGRGVTQSSWGPTVVCCCETLHEAAGLLERIDALELGDHLEVMIAKFDNHGAALRRIG